jgi:glutaredoxin
MITKLYLFTMEGCPHCLEMKKLLDESNIAYEVRDIDEYEEEYEEFQKIVENDYVPALLGVKLKDGKLVEHSAIAPDRDFQELEEALEKVKNFING